MSRRPYEPTHSTLQEAGVLVRLGLPVAIAQVSIITMGVVDTLMVGRLGPTELAAVALGDGLFFTLLVFGMGVVSALDPLISQAYGAGDPARVGRAWRAGLRLSIVITLPMALILLYGGGPILALLDQDPAVVRATMDYIVPRTLGILPGLWYLANRSLLNSMGDTRVPMVVGILANVVNAVLDYAFIYGNWGCPALGVAGAGLVTTISRWFMWGSLHAWVVLMPRYREYVAGRDVGRGMLRQAFRLGLPIGAGHGVEVGAFATASFFMGWLGVVPLASHQIAIKMASTSFMIAVAIGVATSIRVGNGIGARDPEGAQRSAWTGLGLGLVFMSINGALFVLLHSVIVRAFTTDPAVIALGGSLLMVAAAFQLSDGTQAIAAGALRGAGDTVRPMLAQFLAHWGIGLPLGYVFAIRLGYGPLAVWWALAAGLTAAAVLLTWRVRDLRSIAPLQE